MGEVQERVITRKEKSPLFRESFPERLSPTRREREPILYVPGFFRIYAFSGAIRRRLKNLDFEVYAVRLPNFAAGDIRKSARVLLDKMDEVRVLLGVKRLTIIGQGLGGLVARCMAEQLGGKEFLGRLIMLGTPNYGSYFFYPWFLFKGARQMLPGSGFLASLNSAYHGMLEEDPEPPYISVYTHYDAVVIPWSNCRLEGALNLRVGWFCTHISLSRSGSLLGILTKLLEGEDSGEEGGVEDEDNAFLKDLNLSLKENPHDEGDLMRRGKLLMDRGYYKWCIRDLSSLIKLRPDMVEAFMMRGKALRRKMSYDENPIYNWAIRDFNQVIKLRPGWAEAYYERGVCYALLNDWSYAMENWDRALILDRDLYPVYLARGLGRRRKGDITGAVQDFAEVLRIQPDESEALRFFSELQG